MWGVIAFLCGFGCGGICGGVLVWMGLDLDRLPRPDLRELPPATARRLGRARRANRPDIRPALERRGVVLPWPEQPAADKRAWIPAPVDEFTDEQETQ